MSLVADTSEIWVFFYMKNNLWKFLKHNIYTIVLFQILRLTYGIRMSKEHEEAGADITEHMIEPYGPNSLIVVKGFNDRLEVRRRSFYGKFTAFIAISSNICFFFCRGT